MSLPKPIKLSQVDDSTYEGIPPEGFVVVGGIPGGDSGPTAWGDVTGKPATFPPATHTHTIANVTGLQTALDGKQASGSYATAAALAALDARVAALEDPEA